MIYYSHVNEDSRVERELLQSSNCPSVLAVAGSGERVLALMDITCCKKLHVVDVNEEAIFFAATQGSRLNPIRRGGVPAVCGAPCSDKRISQEMFSPAAIAIAAGVFAILESKNVPGGTRRLVCGAIRKVSG